MSDEYQEQPEQQYYAQPASTQQYSAFIPIVITLAVFVLANIFQLVWIVDQKSILTNNYNQATKALENMQAYEKQLESFAVDLTELAKTNKRAEQIVKELNLKINRNGNQPNISPTGSPSLTP